MVDFHGNISGFFANVENFLGKVEGQKQSGSEISVEEFQGIFNKAKEDGEAYNSEVATLFANEFIDGEHKTTVEDIESSFVDVFDQISGLDGQEAIFSEEEIAIILDYVNNPEQNVDEFNAKADVLLNKIDPNDLLAKLKLDTEIEKQLGFEIVPKEDDRIKKDDDGNNYVTVEPWVSNDDDANSSLSKIIMNAYDLEAMGITDFNCDKYKALEKAVMDANPEIYGDENGNGGTPYLSGHEGERNNKILYDGAKVILPGLDQPASEIIIGSIIPKPDPQPKPEDKAVGMTPKPKELDAKQIELLALQLSDAAAGLGTNEEAFAQILGNENLTPTDIINLGNAFQTLTGNSLIDTIDKEFSGKDKETYMSVMTNAIIEMVEQGSEEAIKFMCNEIYAATEGKTGTNEALLKSLFDNASDTVLLALINNYTEVTGGQSIFSALEGDLKESTYNEYAGKLNDILLNQNEV